MKSRIKTKNPNTNNLMHAIPPLGPLLSSLPSLLFLSSPLQTNVRRLLHTLPTYLLFVATKLSPLFYTKQCGGDRFSSEYFLLSVSLLQGHTCGESKLVYKDLHPSNLRSSLHLVTFLFLGSIFYTGFSEAESYIDHTGLRLAVQSRS